VVKRVSADLQALLARLQALANPANVAGMARFGINPQGTLGVSVAVLRGIARETGRSHRMARHLWESGIHEARILATLVEEPELVMRRQMDAWARRFDSWDVCDQACMNLFRCTPFAFEKAAQWARAQPEFVRRAGFALMAALAGKAQGAPDAQFEAFFPLIAEAAGDDRNFVKKAVNWALRGIGKRNPALRERAIAVAEEIRLQDSRAARWVAHDALRELRRGRPAGAGRARPEALRGKSSGRRPTIEF
jgi:3-methyladenine DNA glycosylase AlkD